MVKNPPIEKRVGLTNKLLAEDRLRIDPELKKLSEAMRECAWIKSTIRRKAYRVLQSHHRCARLCDLVGLPAPKAAGWLAPSKCDGA